MLALTLRGGWGVLQMSRAEDPTALTFPDEQWYWHMANRLHAGDGLVGEFGHRAARMPLYPALLSLAAGAEHGVIYARVGQWVVGALAAVFAAMLAANLGGRRPGIAAGVLVACDPGLVGSASLLLTETLFVSVLAAWWWVGWPLSQAWATSTKTVGPSPARLGRPRVARWVCTALLASLCVYTRPVAIGLVLLWIAFVVIRRRCSGRACGACVAVLAVVVLSLVPWAVRNARVTGQWCWLTTRGGISLYDGVRPGATGASDLADVKGHPDVQGLSEHEWNRHFLDAALVEIRQNPSRIAQLGFVKLARTWSPWLHADEVGSPAVRCVFALWTIAVYVLVMLGLVSRRREPGTWAGLLLPIVLICVVHFVYIGSVRYRLAAMPALAVLAALGIEHVLKTRFPRKHEAE